jgi:superfamily II DNA/RNA helicase
MSRKQSGQRPNRSKKLINPSLFVNKAKEQQERAVYVPENTFDDFGFEPRINENLKYIGFVEPTPIQDKALPIALRGQDVLGLANTGTGKTAVFLLPMIDRLLKMQKGQRQQLNLIVVPTRELAQQIGDDLRSFSGRIKIRKTVIVGGGSFNKQVNELRTNPQIIIATPGRLNDHINKGNIHLENCSCFVLDEVDRMLDMGFVRDIRAIASQLKGEHQTMAFSATMTKEVKEILGQFIKKDCKTISVKVSETNDHIEQNVISANGREEKISTLSSLLRKSEFEKVLVFGATKHGVQKLADKLNKGGINADAIHGNKSQNQRQRALKRFKHEEVSVLVATDVAARGLNIEDVSHVINFDQPGSYEDYIHRIGRTGRAGKYGKALTFVN